MTRFKTFVTRCLLAAGLFLTVSTAQADNTVYHPLCSGAAGALADSCTKLAVEYVWQDNYGINTKWNVDHVGAMMMDRCQVPTNQGTIEFLGNNVAGSEEEPSYLSDNPERILPLRVNFVFPSRCAVRLVIRRARILTLTGMKQLGIDIPAQAVVGSRVGLDINLKDR